MPVSPVEHALRAAVRAPSLHNCQPWRFVAHPNRIEVLLAPQRVPPVADPNAHEARLACGAAVLNIRVDLSARGLATEVSLLPDPARPEVLATVHVLGRARPSAQDLALSEAVERRHTNRRPFLDREVPEHTRAALVRAAAAEGARLHLADRPGDLAAITDLVRRANHVQDQDPAYQAELRGWVTADHARPDGVPRSATGAGGAAGGLLTLRDFTAGTPEVRAAVDFESRPVLAVLTTRGDAPRDQIAAGQAMQRVLLAATDLGLAASFLSQPIEVPPVRSALRDLLGEHPHVVLRLGYGHPGVPTPRHDPMSVTTVVTLSRADVEEGAR